MEGDNECDEDEEYEHSRYDNERGGSPTFNLLNSEESFKVNMNSGEEGQTLPSTFL